MASDATTISIAPFTPADRDGVAQLIVGIQRGEFGIAITYDDQPDLKDIPGPKLLHALTQKGKGYKFSEEGDPTTWHARTYGLLALKQAEHLPPFFKARACEALARAEMISGNRVIMTVYLDKARALANLVEHEGDRAQLSKDLDSIC